jgi:tetratricopeptide (TPR) repeat protein/serine phosphatase RsbU (regulator of sigma subunit)
MKLLFIGLFFYLSIFTQAFAQNSAKLDSLKKIAISSQDTNAVKAMNSIAWELRNYNFDQALDYLEKSTELALRLNYNFGLAEAYNFRGLLFRNMGDYPSAMEFYLKALKIAEQSNILNTLAYSYNNIGEVAKFQGNYTQAIESIQKAILIFEQIKDKRGLGYGYLRLAEVYQAQKNYSEALKGFMKSLEIRKSANDLPAIATSLNRIGLVYLFQNDTKSAIQYLEEAKKIFEQTKDKRGLTGILADLSNAYKISDDIKNAILFANQSLQMAQELPSPEYIKKASQILYEIYSSQKNFEKALSYQNLFLSAKDSLMKEDLNKEIAKLQANYALEKKQAEIELQLDAIRLQRWVIIIGSVGFGMVVILLFILTNVNRKRRLANKLLQTQKQEIEYQKIEIESQRDNLNVVFNDLQEKNLIIQKKNEDTHSSIMYAKNIQAAVLSAKKDLQEYLPEHFILFRPRDIVSGDFYWFAHKHINGEDTLILAAVDCTGHGVPGAFMSLIGDSLLNEIVHDLEIHQPAEILIELHKHVQRNLNQRQSKNRDGMELALCNINLTQKKLTFAGAGNPLIYIQNNESYLIKGSIHSVGGFRQEAEHTFSETEIDISVPTTFYIFSDGFQDQFGGPHNKKFMVTRFKRMLYDVHKIPIHLQEEVLNQGLDDWMNEANEKQTDDILVIGVKI